MTIWLIGIAAYLFAAVVSAQVFEAIGERSSNTVGGSWTGDSTLDFWSVLLWPLSWLIFAGLICGTALARALRLRA